MVVTREDVLELMARRDDMEAESNNIRNELNQLGVGTQGSLVTADGFPRDDLDIPAVRELRVRLIRLDNDIRAILEEIRVGLNTVLNSGQNGNQLRNGQMNGTSRHVLEPFCIVNSVEPNSPASEAGLALGDKIVEFGGITIRNHNGLRAISDVVEPLRPISVHVLRDLRTVELTLTPRSGWGGRGLLGCHILPLPTV